MYFQQNRMLESKEEEPTIVYKAPIFPDYLEFRDILYSPHNSNDVFNDILITCSEMFAKIIKQKRSNEKFKIKASFHPSYLNGPDTMIEFKFYTVSFDTVELTAVHMQKTSGDLFEYHKIYKFFQKTIGLTFLSIPSEHKRRKTDESPLKNEIELLP